jgi:hydrogenase nickel incorporation protein HypA/HybF
MHDLKFCQEILNALNRKQASLANGETIRTVKVRLSPLCHVTPKALAETFGVMAKDTPFAKVQLVVETLRLGMKCESCNNEFTVEKPTFACPACNEPSINLVHQKEFTVDSIEIEHI